MIINRKYERDVDLLLAEEFEVSQAFSRWFIDRTKFSGESWQVLSVHLSRSDAEGETDLEVTFKRSNGEAFALLVEDKVNAPLQPDQLARYHRRARTAIERGDYSDYDVVLCAPRSYYEAQPKSREFPRFIAYEDIADQFQALANVAPREEAKRHQYRADFLKTAANTSTNTWERVDDPATNLFWQSAYDMAVRDFPILEMKEPRYTKGTRWITLRPSCLPTQPKRVYVDLKGRHGRVDLTFSYTRAAEFYSQIKSFLDGKTVHQAGKAAVIRVNIEPFSVTEGLNIELPKVRQAFAAAEALVQFYLQHKSALDLAAGARSVLDQSAGGSDADASFRQC
jgi:hypothetical protein